MGRKPDPEDLNLIVHLRKLGTIQAKSMKCETNIRNNQYRTSFLFVFSFLDLTKWNTFKEAPHFSRAHTTVMWSWNTFLVCAYKAQNKAWRWKTIWQLMTYNDRESLGNGKKAGTFGKAVLYQYWFHHPLPSETLISDSPSPGKGKAMWASLDVKKLELFSPLCLGPAYLLQVKPFSVSPLRKQR